MFQIVIENNHNCLNLFQNVQEDQPPLENKEIRGEFNTNSNAENDDRVEEPIISNEIVNYFNYVLFIALFKIMESFLFIILKVRYWLTEISN